MKFLRGFWRLFRKETETNDNSLQENLINKEGEESRTISKSDADNVTVYLTQKTTLQKRQYSDDEKKPPSIGARSIDLKAQRKAASKPPNIFKKKLQKAYIQVGLDFGTSATKVVFSQLGRRFSKALNFNHNLASFPNYCLPSLCAFNNSGELLLGIEAAKYLKNSPWNSGIQRLKVIVAGIHDHSFRDQRTHDNFENYIQQSGHDKSLTPERLTAIYLAYAMKLSRKIIINLPEYRGVELDLVFNICMPIDHIENNLVCDEFKSIFLNAEALDRQWGKSLHNFNPLKASYDLFGKIPTNGTKVFAVPESVAALASYLVSLAKQDGLHAVIDLGSGTTDVSICNLMGAREQNRSYWYAAKNIPKGMVGIEQIISEYIMTCNDQQQCNQHDIVKFIEELNSIVVSIEEATAGRCQLSHNIFTGLYSLKKSKEYYTTWGNAYRHLTNQTLWGKVTVFLSGGGSNLPYVKKIFSEPWWKNLNVEYPVYKLPTPDDYFPGDSNAPFERMSVAYGLARPLPELDDFVLPDDCPDQTPAPLPVRELDHEDIYTT